MQYKERTVCKMNIFTQNINKISDSEYHYYLSLCTNERRDFLNLCKSEKYKKQSLAAEMLAKKAISELYGIEPEGITILKNKNGKPFLDCSQNRLLEDVHFNISHSGDMAACVVSKGQTGIDIEKIRSVNMKTTKKFCTQAEKEYITDAEDENEKNIRFLKIWTLKESYLKAIGTGIAGELKEIEFYIEESVKSSNDKYEFKLVDSIDEYIIAASCEKTVN